MEQSLCTPTGKGLDSRPSAKAKRFDSSHRHISNSHSNLNLNFDFHSKQEGFNSSPFHFGSAGAGKLMLLRKIYALIV